MLAVSRRCPFCSPEPDAVLLANEHGFVIRDAYPVSRGHTLIIPRRHIASFFEATAEEQAALLALLGQARERLCAELEPDAFNIGVNDGAAAGQTMPHLHIHIIPRYAGDCADPRGGLRWIFPDKVRYWKEAEEFRKGP
jgi:diadenosine tetraphosphate (Ap4A) HIT family hydrolase